MPQHMTVGVSIVMVHLSEFDFWLERGFNLCIAKIVQEMTSNNKVDYLVVVSDEWSDLVFSNQNFFDRAINKALEEAGFGGRVTGRMGTGGAGIAEAIRKEHPNVYVPNNEGSACLYMVSDQSASLA